MVAIAIVSADPIWRQRLTQLLSVEPGLTVVSIDHNPTAALRLLEQHRVDAILADAPSREQLEYWRCHVAVIVLLDGVDDAEAGLDSLDAGARAVLPRSAGRDEIVAAIKAVVSGLAVLPQELLPTLLDRTSRGDGLVNGTDGSYGRLTPRELEVLTAMAEGASNKAIARRLGISFHTVKFHVAAILTKLNADSRTEAVTRAAQLGHVML
jgi:two-component system, NarL family, response regulator YdfI